MQVRGSKTAWQPCWPHAGDKAHKEEIHPGFETQGRGYQKSKTVVTVAPQKGQVS